MTNIDSTADVSTDVLVSQFDRAVSFSTELVAAKPKALANRLSGLNAGSQLVLIDDIVVLEDFNIRIKNEGYFAHIESLAQSIESEGFYLDKPLAGYGAEIDGRPVVVLVDGHCRFAAVKLAIARGSEIDSVPLVLKDKATSMEDLFVAMSRSSDSRKLSPLELAIICKRLLKFNWGTDKIAQKIGKTEAYVNQLLTLAGSPKAIRDMVESGETTAALAVDVVNTHGADATNVMQGALAEAKAQGKARVTKRFMPAAIHRKALVKAAPKMLDAITRLKEDKSYKRLPEDLRELFEQCLKEIPAATPAADDAQAPAEGV